MALTLFLVRHGETLFNQRGLMQGWVDSPLTPRGVEQAERAAALLRDRPLVGLYASTSERAADTAEVIGRHHPGLAVVTRRGLKELHFGDSEALPDDDVWRETDARQFFADLLAGRGAGLAGGETATDFLARVGAAFAEITAAHADGGEVCVVSHGVTLATYLWGAGWTTPGPVANASVSVVSVDPQAGTRLLGVDVPDPGAVADRAPAAAPS
jgi:probable phosphoglycerate mutase